MNYWATLVAVILHLWILGPVTWLTSEAKDDRNHDLSPSGESFRGR